MALLKDYLRLIGGGESRTVHQRFAFLAACGMLIGRNAYIQHGAHRIYPNMYVMLVGNSGARKSAVVKQLRSLLTKIRFTDYAPHVADVKLMLERLATGATNIKARAEIEELEESVDITTMLGAESAECAKMFGLIEEWCDFADKTSKQSYSWLGNMWDNNEDIVIGKTRIIKPLVGFVGCNTAAAFSESFPSTTFAQGFTARVLIVHANQGNKITFPDPVDVVLEATIKARLLALSSNVLGALTFDAAARQVIDKIYHHPFSVPDARFAAYNSRRLTHLFKLCIILTALNGDTVITKATVFEANAYLLNIEVLMPQALGEYGISKSSVGASAVMAYLRAMLYPMDFESIWAATGSNFEKIPALTECLNALVLAGKLLQLDTGYVATRVQVPNDVAALADFSHLTQGELNDAAE